MSRIAGVLTSPSHPPLTEALIAKVSGQGWTQVADALVGTTMAWTGVRSPNLAVMDQVIAVVDGNFYNPDEWGLSPSLLAANAAAS